jgi:nitroreductase
MTEAVPADPVELGPRDTAPTEREIHPLLAERYSPHAFADRDVPEEALGRLLEAARWAPSSFNEQPWRFLVGTRSTSPETREAILEILAEGNQAWAEEAPVLVLSATRKRFSFNDEPNAHARHDVGLAMAQLTVQATAEGLGVHQMAGFDADAARERFAIPEELEPVSVTAIGYPGDPGELDEQLRERATGPRQRDPVDEIVARSHRDPPW